MVQKSVNSISSEVLTLYDALIASIPELERKGKTMPYTSHNGHMFSYLGPDGTMALRLAPDDLSAFLKDHNTELMVSHGAVMKEYAAVPEALFKNTKALKPYLLQSYAYIKTLKPKPTKK